MGNQNGKTSSDSYYQQQMELLQWRADIQYNTHIARTLIFKAEPTCTASPQKMLSPYYSNGLPHCINSLAELCSNSADNTQCQQILFFERYTATLVILVGSLAMEESLYALITLLSGYESIYRKMGRICVHERCCFITFDGQLRAWLHTDPTSNFPDQQLIAEEGAYNSKVEFTTEASICSKIIDMTLHLSNKCPRFLQFYLTLKRFIANNILQHLNFRAIRTFVNGFVFYQRCLVPSSLAQAMRRVTSKPSSPRLSIQGLGKEQDSQEIYTFLQAPLSLDRSAEIPSSQPKRTNKSIQTSHIDLHANEFSSTQGHTPTKQLGKQAINSVFCSQIMPETKHHFSKTSDTFPTTCLRQQKSGEANLDPTNQKRTKKMVKFHSYNPSFNIQFNEDSQFKQNDCGQYSLNQSRHLESQEEHQRPNNNKSEFARSLKESRTTHGRFVSGLISNKQISVCESLGSFQSLKNSEDSGYQGILMAMGRSVIMEKLPSRKRIDNNRAYLSEARSTF